MFLKSHNSCFNRLIAPQPISPHGPVNKKTVYLHKKRQCLHTAMNHSGFIFHCMKNIDFHRASCPRSIPHLQKSGPLPWSHGQYPILCPSINHWFHISKPSAGSGNMPYGLPNPFLSPYPITIQKQKIPSSYVFFLSVYSSITFFQNKYACPLPKDGETSQFPGYFSKHMAAAFFPILFLLNFGCTINSAILWPKLHFCTYVLTMAKPNILPPPSSFMKKASHPSSVK